MNNDEKKSGLLRRLKLVEGQVRGLQRMIENDVYCIDLKWHFTNLFEHPENEWFLTDNKAFTDNYDICMKLYEMDLIAKKEEPIYRNGSYCGNKVYFKYNKELKF